MTTQTFEQALNEALNFAEDSYSENRDRHTIHNGLVHCNESYLKKQVKISRQLLDRLNEIDSQYNLTDEQQDELNYHIQNAWQDVYAYQGEWERMYQALHRINRMRSREERRRRREEQQIQIRRIRRGRDDRTARRNARDRFMAAFGQISPEEWQAILRRADNQRADNQRADDNANFH